MSMCLLLCAYMGVHTCVAYAYRHICMCAYMAVCMQGCLCVCACVCVRVCTHVRAYVCVTERQSMKGGKPFPLEQPFSLITSDFGQSKRNDLPRLATELME